MSGRPGRSSSSCSVKSRSLVRRPRWVSNQTGQRRVLRRGDETVDQAPARAAEIGGRAGDLDVEGDARRDGALRRSSVRAGRRRGRAPAPPHARPSGIHHARDAIGARGAREVDADAVEARGDDLGRALRRGGFRCRNRGICRGPRPTEERAIRAMVFPFRQRCHIVSGAGVNQWRRAPRRQGVMAGLDPASLSYKPTAWPRLRSGVTKEEKNR